MISVIFGVLFTFGMIFGVGVIAGDPMALIDLITLGVVIGLSLIGTIFSSMAKPRSKLFSNFGNFSVIAGWIAFLMGATIISGSMDLGDLKNLGPALAVALLAPLYGYTLKFCCMIGETYFSLDYISPEIQLKWPCNVVITKSHLTSLVEVNTTLMRLQVMAHMLHRSWVSLKVICAERRKLDTFKKLPNVFHIYRRDASQFVDAFYNYVVQSADVSWVTLYRELEGANTNAVEDLHGLILALKTLRVQHWKGRSFATKK